jgi:hypothetical protein
MYGAVVESILTALNNFLILTRHHFVRPVVPPPELGLAPLPEARIRKRPLTKPSALDVMAAHIPLAAPLMRLAQAAESATTASAEGAMSVDDAIAAQYIPIATPITEFVPTIKYDSADGRSFTAHGILIAGLHTDHTPTSWAHQDAMEAAARAGYHHLNRPTLRVSVSTTTHFSILIVLNADVRVADDPVAHAGTLPAISIQPGKTHHKAKSYARYYVLALTEQEFHSASRPQCVVCVIRGIVLDPSTLKYQINLLSQWVESRLVLTHRPLLIPSEHQHKFGTFPNAAHLPKGTPSSGREPILTAYIPRQHYSTTMQIHAILGLTAEMTSVNLSMGGLEFAYSTSTQDINCIPISNPKFAQAYITSSISGVVPTTSPSALTRLMAESGVPMHDLKGMYKYAASLESTSPPLTSAIDAIPPPRPGARTASTHDYINLIWANPAFPNFDPDSDLAVDHSVLAPGSRHVKGKTPFGWLRAGYSVITTLHSSLAYMHAPKGTPHSSRGTAGSATPHPSAKRTFAAAVTASLPPSGQPASTQSIPMPQSVAVAPPATTAHAETPSAGYTPLMGGLSNTQRVEVEDLFRRMNSDNMSSIKSTLDGFANNMISFMRAADSNHRALIQALLPIRSHQPPLPIGIIDSNSSALTTPSWATSSGVTHTTGNTATAAPHSIATTGSGVSSSAPTTSPSGSTQLCTPP